MARFVGLETADVLIGGADADEVIGNGGNDTLSGGAGADTLTGGQGSDRFIDTLANLNGDTITDFSADDVIVLSDSAPLNGFVEFTGGTLNYAGMSIALSGLAPGVFAASRFITSGVGLTYYSPRSVTAPGNAANNVLTYGGISLDAAGITFTNTASGRILFRGLTINQGGSTFINDVGGEVLSINGSNGSDYILNRGRISFEVSLGGGDDRFQQVEGAITISRVSLGGGDDALELFDSLGTFQADGGEGYDSVVLKLSLGNFDAELLSGFEAATITAGPFGYHNVTDLSGLRQIAIDSVGSTGPVILVNSFSPLASVTVNGGVFGMAGTTIQSLTGSDRSNFVSIGDASQISGSIALGDGSDAIELYRTNNLPFPTLSGSVAGGTGRDILLVRLSSSNDAPTFDVSRFSGFEQMFISGFPGVQASATIYNAGPDFDDIRVSNSAALALHSSILPRANVDATFNARLFIAADSMIASIYSVNAREANLVLDTPSGNFDASSQIFIDGRVSGDIEMQRGDDTVDARTGTIDGTIFGNGGNDILRTGSGNNRLVGGFGNDTLEGGADNDALEGGPGFDTALYSASRAQATVTRSANGTLTVTAAAEGTDTLSGIEQIRFGESLFITARFRQPDGAVLAEFASGNSAWSSQDRSPRLLADVNGDGRADVLAFGQNGTLVALHQVDGTFAASSTGIANFGVNQGWTSDNTFHREMADVNNDGLADIVGFGFAGVLVSLAQANGTFGAAALGSNNFNPANGWSTQNGAARTLADVNGDGFADIVGFGAPGTFVALGTGTGSFGTATFALANFGIAQGWSSNNVFHREVGDVNGDGRADIVGFGQAGTLVALGQANGTFGAATLALGNFGTNQGWSTQDVFTRDLADVNGDGRDDVVGFGVAGTFVAYGQTNGTFSAAAFDLANFGRDQGWNSDNTFHRELADVNGDGLADIVGFGFGGVFVASAFDGLVL